MCKARLQGRELELASASSCPARRAPDLPVPISALIALQPLTRKSSASRSPLPLLRPASPGPSHGLSQVFPVPPVRTEARGFLVVSAPPDVRFRPLLCPHDPPCSVHPGQCVQSPFPLCCRS